MKLLWAIAVCACWLALLVQPEPCMGYTKETIERRGNLINVPNNHPFASSLLSVVSPQEIRGYDKNQIADLEQKVYITGFNGLCVTVKNGEYHNGDDIVLSECKDAQKNQLWIFGTDQTIRSNGKCLTTYGYTPGDYVMIFDCKTAVPDATKWEFQSNLGRIINPKSGLSLTADTNDNLVVDYHNYVPRQIWLPTNDTKPLVSKIVDYNSLCLTLDGFERVKMDVCDENIKDERWALYPDGTIRPEQHQDRCLRFEFGQHMVSVGACGGWTNEPWIINESDGTILNLATGMVMDVKVTQVHPPIYSVYLNCYDESSVSQIWSMISA